MMPNLGWNWPTILVFLWIAVGLGMMFVSFAKYVKDEAARLALFILGLAILGVVTVSIMDLVFKAAH